MEKSLKISLKSDLEKVLFEMVRFPRMYYFLENGLPMTALFSKVHQLLGNAIGNEAAYSEKHCVLGNLQPIRGYDFQKVLHIRKIDGRIDMFFQNV